ncbi:MAG: helix-turn-helix transcriptional regulator, partial [Cyanobacteriota bacterium]
EEEKVSDNTISWDDIRAEVLADPEVKAEYEALEDEYSIASQLIALRATTGLTQREFAQAAGMKQSQLARIESGKQIPKLETLAKLAAAAGYRIEVNFIAIKGKEAPELKPLQIAVPDMDGETSPSPVSFVHKFLEGDDPVAVQVRERLGERSLVEVAAELEKCLSIPEEDDRLFTVKKVLVGSVTGGGTNRDRSADNDEIELLDLAESLLEKLTGICSQV